MHKTHGDTFSFNLGSQPCVVLGDFDLFKQLASSDNFNWRPHGKDVQRWEEVAESEKMTINSKARSGMKL